MQRSTLYQYFQNAVVLFLAACFIWIGIGTVGRMASLSIVSSRYNGSVLFLGLFLTVMLILDIRLGFLWIASQQSAKRQFHIAAVLFGVMALCYLILLTQIDANLRNDAYQDADAACYLTDHDAIPADNKHPGELLSFGNNYFFIWMTSKVIRLLFALGLSDIVPFLQGINAFAMLLGVFFTWLLVWECKSLTAANQVLLLCAANPLFYGFTFWYYSNSLSIPLMMAIPYAALRLWRSPSRSRALLWALAEGFLLFLGYQLRPTAVFPFIAICLIAPFHRMGNVHPAENTADPTTNGHVPADTRAALLHPHVVSHLLPCMGVILLTAAVFFGAFSHVRQARFGELIPHNRPITYWLAMGAHGTGNLETNGTDVQYVKSLTDDDNKTLLCFKRALRHYRRNGIPGTLDLWARKTATTWSDGYGGISRRIIAGEAKSPLYTLLAGDSKDLFILYCQAFRLMTVCGMFLFCAFAFRRQIPSPMFVFVLTMLGGIVFYFLWEARAFYSAPFVPVMLILAQDGFMELFQRHKNWFSCIAPANAAPGYPTETGTEPASTDNGASVKENTQTRMFPLACCVLITLFVCMDFLTLTGQVISADHFRIYTKGKQRHYAAIEDEGNPVTSIEQDFTVYKPFNRISLPAKLKEEAGGYSAYRVSLTNGDVTVYDKRITASSVKNFRLKLSLKPAADAGHYVLHIEKLQPQKADITFFTKYDSYYIDAYRGQLSVNGGDSRINDLGLTVFLHTEKEPYLPKAVRFSLAFLLLVFSLAVLWGNTRRTATGQASP